MANSIEKSKVVGALLKHGISLDELEVYIAFNCTEEQLVRLYSTDEYELNEFDYIPAGRTIVPVEQVEPHMQEMLIVGND